jgi:predicted HNH restriction endonuclease
MIYSNSYVLLDIKTLDAAGPSHVATHHTDRSRLSAHLAIATHSRRNQYGDIGPNMRLVIVAISSCALESEIKRLELEIQRLNSSLERTLCSLHTFESETMRLELENDQLSSRIEEANYVQWHSTDYINAQLALRDDALERQRIRDDGIFCSSCALGIRAYYGDKARSRIDVSPVPLSLWLRIMHT